MMTDTISSDTVLRRELRASSGTERNRLEEKLHPLSILIQEFAYHAAMGEMLCRKKCLKPVS